MAGIYARRDDSGGFSITVDPSSLPGEAEVVVHVRDGVPPTEAAWLLNEVARHVAGIPASGFEEVAW